MKKVLIIITILVLVGAGIYSFFFHDRTWSIRNYPGQGSTVVAFGDSLIQGIGATEGNDLVSLLSKKANIEIINEGVSGNTTDDGLKRIDAVLEKHDPKLVILLLGGNDYLKRVPDEQVFKNLETVIQKIHNSGSMVLLLGVQGGVLRDNFKSRFALLAKKHQTAYVSNVLAGLIGKREFMFDGIHPNSLGYENIANRLYPVLTTLLK